MSKLRSFIVWLVVFTQVWAPVLAQTFPIHVDREAPGQKPVVGMQNGVPVVHIAPPSAGGVSDNRYTHFNVGPSGVILNNSGGASQTHLAGQVSGNLMLGNQRAAVILNQVTAPNPSQLLGALEVAGGSARVIVANPAGITCNGCGFLNADRATLTTGRPSIGPDGAMSFDVATGQISVTGEGLYGSGLSQVDLITRSLEVNAGIWADRLNVILGANRIDDVTGDVQGRAGEGAAPAFALDTAALGGMYANSIRLIGTEAGVGVNIAGSLRALTGDLQVNAAGDLSVHPGGSLHGGRDVQLSAGRDLAMHGEAFARQGLSLNAQREVSINGLASAGEAVHVQADRDLTLGARAGIASQGPLRLIAGQNLAARNTLILSDSDVTLRSGGDLMFETTRVTGSDSPEDMSPSHREATAGADPTARADLERVAVGVVSSRGPIELQAEGHAVLPGQINAAGGLYAEAVGDMSADQAATLQAGKGLSLLAGAGLHWKGSVQAGGRMDLVAGADLRVEGSAWAYGDALHLSSGRDLDLGVGSHAQGIQVVMRAPRDVSAAGRLMSSADVELHAGRAGRVDGHLGADGDVNLFAGDTFVIAQDGRVNAGNSARLNADGCLQVQGAVRSNQTLDLSAGSTLTVEGLAAATYGSVRLAATDMLTLGPMSYTLAGGALSLRTDGALHSAGAVATASDLTLHAGASARLDGQTHADGRLTGDAAGDITTGARSRLASGGALSLDAKKRLVLGGTVQSNASLTLHAKSDAQVDGRVYAYGGPLQIVSGRDLTLGWRSHTQGVGLAVQADRDIVAAGLMASQGGLSVVASRDALFAGEIGALGSMVFSAGRDMKILAPELRASGINHTTLGPGRIPTAQKRSTATDFLASSPVSALVLNEGVASQEAGAMQLATPALARGQIRAKGPLLMTTGGTLAADQAVRVQSSQGIAMHAHEVHWAGSASAAADVTVSARHDLHVDGSLLAQDKLHLKSRRDLSLGPDSRARAQEVIVRASRDVGIEGALSALGDAVIRAERDARVDGRLGVARNLYLDAGDAIRIGTTGVVAAKRSAVLGAGGDIGVAGVLRGDKGLKVNTLGKLVVDGTTSADYGALKLIAEDDMLIGSTASVIAAGPTLMRTHGTLNIAGEVLSQSRLDMHASRDAAVSGRLRAEHASELIAGGNVELSPVSQWVSGGPLRVSAGNSLTAGGKLQSHSTLHLTATQGLQVDGNIAAYGGESRLKAGADVHFGAASDVYGRRVVASAGGELGVLGQIRSPGDVSLSAGSHVHAAGTVTAGGPVTVRAGGALNASGKITSSSDLTLRALGDATIHGQLHAGKALSLTAFGDLAVGDTSRWTSVGPTSVLVGGALNASGAMASSSDLTLRVVRDASIHGQLHAGRALSLRVLGDVEAGVTSQWTSVGPTSVYVGGALAASGVMASSSDLGLQVVRDAEVHGRLDAGGALSLTALGDVEAGASSQWTSVGSTFVYAGGDLDASGTVTSSSDLTLRALRDATVHGRLHADGALSVTALGNVKAGAKSQWASVGPTFVYAGGDLGAWGAVTSSSDLTLQAVRNATVHGRLHADGALSLTALGDVEAGAKSQWTSVGPTSVYAGGDLGAWGAVTSSSDLTLRAVRDATVHGRLHADGALSATALGDVKAGAKSRWTSVGPTFVEVGGALTASGVMASSSDLSLHVDGDATVDGQLSADGALSLTALGDVDAGAKSQWTSVSPMFIQAGGRLNASGAMKSSSDLTLQVIRDAAIHGQLDAGGALLLTALGDVEAGAKSQLTSVGPTFVHAGGGLNASGTVKSSSGLTLQAIRDAKVYGPLRAGGALSLMALGDVEIGARSRWSSIGPTFILTEGSLNGLGTITSSSDLTLQVIRNAAFDGRLHADGTLSVTALGDVKAGARSQWTSVGPTFVDAGGGLNASGTVKSSSDLTLQAVRDAKVYGPLRAGGALSLMALGDVEIGAKSRWSSIGPTFVLAEGSLNGSGTIKSSSDLTLQAVRDATVQGQLQADGALSLTGLGEVKTGAESRWDAGRLLRINAGSSLVMGGTARSQSGLRLDAAQSLRVHGDVVASGDVLHLEAGTNLIFSPGSTAMGRSIVAYAPRDFHMAGKMTSPGSVAWVAGRDVHTRGEVVAGGPVDLQADRHLRVSDAAQIEASGPVRALARQNLYMDGALRGQRNVRLHADGAMAVNGVATARRGALDLRADQGLAVGEKAVVSAAGPLTADTDGDLSIAGNFTSLATIVTRAARTTTVSGRVYAKDALDLSTGGLLKTDRLAQLESMGLMTLNAQDMHLAGLHGSASAMVLDARRDMRVQGEVVAERMLTIASGLDLETGADSRVHGRGMTASARRDLTISGALESTEDMSVSVAGMAWVGGRVDADGGLRVASRELMVMGKGRVTAGRDLTTTVQADTTIAGRLQAQGAARLDTGDHLRIGGHVVAANRSLTLNAKRGDIQLYPNSFQQAGSGLEIDAGHDVHASGNTSAVTHLTLHAGRHAEIGGILAATKGPLTATADADMTVKAGARVQSESTVAVHARGQLTHAATTYAKDHAEFSADDVLSNTGTITSGGNVKAGAGATLDQSGQIVAGASPDGIAAQRGNVTLMADVVTHRGTSQASGDLTMISDVFDLATSHASAGGKLDIRSKTSIDAENARLSGDSVAITGTQLHHPGGRLESASDMLLELSGPLNNSAGHISATGDAQVYAARIDTTDGTLAARSLNIRTPAAVNSQRGLIQAQQTLTIHAHELNNRDTLSASDTPVRGLVGNIVNITASTIDNRHGAMMADQAIWVSSQTFPNNGGLLSSKGAVDVYSPDLDNHQGRIFAGERLALSVDRLPNLGTLQSAADLFLTVPGDLALYTPLTAERDLGLTVGGRLDNYAKLSSGHDATLKASQLYNSPTGEVVARRHNVIRTTKSVVNDGLIDGVRTHIQTPRLDNTRRIYGDTVAIESDVLENDSSAAVIASRDALDIAVRVLGNRNHALIYAAGDLRVGRLLNANGHAHGTAERLTNAWSTIDVGGNADISAAQQWNLNRDFRSEIVSLGSHHKIYYRPEGSSDMYDAQTTWLADLVTASSSKDPAWLDDDQERRLLLPSSTYPEDKFGPPFNYARGGRGQRGRDAPIWPAYKPPHEPLCGGSDQETECRKVPAAFYYPVDARIWSVFGVTPPEGQPPEKPVEKGDCAYSGTCRGQKDRQKAYEAALAAYSAPYQELTNRVRAFNADFDKRMVKNFLIYRVEESVAESQVVASDPALITVGADATLRGVIHNEQSRIIAGRALNIVGDLSNIGATGERRVQRNGTVQRTYERKDKRKYDAPQPYTGQSSVTPIELAVAVAKGDQPVTTGARPGASAIDAAQRPMDVTRVAIGHQKFVVTAPPSAILPDSQLFVVSPHPDALYRVTTDPQFLRDEFVVSSDSLLQMLQLMQSPSGRDALTVALSQTASGEVPVALSQTLSGDAPVALSQTLSGDAPVALSQTLSNEAPVTWANELIRWAPGDSLQEIVRALPAASIAELMRALPRASIADIILALPSAPARRIKLPPIELGDAAESVPDIDIAFVSDRLAAGLRAPALDTIARMRGTRVAGWDALVPAGARFLTPSGQPKRLGDGLYEQKLVRDQILATTGQRYLANYLNATQQYLALMAAGAKFAAEHDVSVGVALTEAQMRQLTSDLVWLVEQAITLPDGTVDYVLVPQVYLIVRDGDLRGDGTLVAGDTVNISAEGDVVNTGTVLARHATVVVADNIVNRSGGTIQASTVDLTARENIAQIAALIKADTLAMKAGQAIALTSTMSDYDHGQTAGRDLAGVSQVVADNVQMTAGEDIRMTAASVTARENIDLQAGRDITLTTLQQGHKESYDFGKRNRADFSVTSEIGTGLSAGANLSMRAGQDIVARASEVSAGAQLAVAAGRDIRLMAGQATGSARDEFHYKTRKLFSRKSSHSILSVEWARAQATTFTGDTAIFVAGRDLDVAGSSIGAKRDATLFAAQDVKLTPGQETETTHRYERSQRTGFGAAGGLSVGSRKQTDSLDSHQVFHAAGTLGSVTGDVRVIAGRAVNITAGHIMAPQGDISVGGKTIEVDAASDTTREHERHELRQTGLTLTASNPIVSAMQTGVRMAEAASKTDNPVMQGLAAGTAALAASNAYDAVQAASSLKDASALSKLGGVSVKLSLGSTKSSSVRDSEATHAVGSVLTAGRDIDLTARGAGHDSDIHLIGSTLSAGRNASLSAEGDLLLQAARNAAKFTSVSKNHGGSIGIGYTTGKTNGFSVELGASIGRGSERGSQESWTHTHIAAGQALNLRSGGDTTLRGAAAHADQIVADVGGNLLIESLQDKSRYQSKTQSADIQASVCIPPACVGNSVAGGVSTGRMKSTFESVTEQSGLWAGDGGYQIAVQDNTRLIGGVIASNDRAVDSWLNRLDTGTLVTEDIENTAQYSAHQVSVSGGMGFGGGDKSKESGLGTTKGGQVAGGATKEAGTSVSTGASGLGMAMPMVAAASGSASSTTRSAISAGDIRIRNQVAQQALSGMTVAETLAALNRDTSDTLNSLSPIFDKEKIEAGFEIAQEASRQVGQFMANRAREADALKAAVEAEQNPALKAKLQARYEEAAKWGADGEYRLAMTVLTGAASANVVGSVGQFVQATAANYLQALGVREVKTIADALDSEAARAALQAIVGCAGAVGQNQKCGAGATGAAAGVVINNLVERLSGASAAQLSTEEKDAHSNLVTSLVAGLSTALGGESAIATLAAQLETQKNYLGQKSADFRASEQKQFNVAIATCGPGNPEACERARELAGLSEERDQALARACANAGSPLCRAVVDLAKASGNVVFFDRHGVPFAVPADSPIIQATPNGRDGTFHYSIATSVAEGLAIDVGGGAFVGLGVAARGVLRSAVPQFILRSKGRIPVGNAFADPRKFSDYIFKPGADHGKDVVFKSLGYTADDSVALSQLWQKQAAEKYAKGEFKLGKADQYGQRIDIEIVLPGKGLQAGKTSHLRSGWMIQGDGSIKLNTPFSGFIRSPK